MNNNNLIVTLGVSHYENFLFNFNSMRCTKIYFGRNVGNYHIVDCPKDGLSIAVPGDNKKVYLIKVESVIINSDLLNKLMRVWTDYKFEKMVLT